MALTILGCAIGATAVRAQFWLPDPTFAPVLNSPALPVEQRVTAVAQQPDGKLLATGYVKWVNGQTRANPTAPLRFNVDGSLDPSFNASESADGLYLQPSGKIVTPGGVRLNANGSRDTTFSFASDFVAVGAADTLGRLYVRRADGTLIRTTVDGDDDGLFRAQQSGLVRGIAPFANGSVAVALVRDPYSMLTIIRLRADGSEDPTFKPYVGSISVDGFLGLIALPDGRVLLYGTTTVQSGVAMRFVRLGSNGMPDYTYVAPESFVSSPQPADALTLAGVLYDVLREARAADGTHVRETISSGRFTATLDISGGALWLATAAWASDGGLARYNRVSATDLTIDPRPTLFYASPPSAAEYLLGEPLWLSAPSAGGLFPLTYQWTKDGVPIAGATKAALKKASLTAAEAGTYTVVISNAYGSVTSKPVVVTVNTTPAPLIVTQPLTDQSLPIGTTLLWWTYATGNPYPTFTWTHNGGAVEVVTGGVGKEAVSSVQIMGVQPEHAGVYEATATSGGSSRRMTAILGVLSNAKTAGAATEISPNVVHPNKNVYDQVLLTGASAAITADAKQVTRISFVDLTNDIVQVEMTGAGTLALMLENAAEPAPAAHYNQREVSYVRGHPGIVVAGADETTHVSVFSVGRANAVNQALFRDGVDYDGMADVAFIAISSPNGRCGSLRMGNVRFYAAKGLTGVYAPGVAFAGPVYVGDIDAFDAATPALVLESAAELRITGGDLQQTNGKPVRLGELTSFNFAAGTTSHGAILPAQPNRGTFERDGVPVPVVNSSP